MSAPETTVAPVEEVKPADTAPVTATVVPEVVTPAVVAPAVEADSTPVVEATAATEVPKKEAKDKSPNFLTKLFGSLSIKGGKKKEGPVVQEPTAAVEAAVVVPVEVPVEVPVVEAPPEVPAAPVAEVETAKAPETPKAHKVSRRLSARVGDFFKPKPRAEVTPPAKVDEHPPKIDEPERVAPLENPATGAAPANPVEAATPVVAAAA